MKDQGAYLGHIIDAIQDIQLYASVGRDVFMAERMRQDAIIRKLGIIGQAVKNLSAETQGARTVHALAENRRHARSAHS